MPNRLTLRVLAGIGTGMIALTLIVVGVYAIAAVAIVAIVAVLGVVVSHPFRKPTPVPPAYDAHDDEAARAHRERMAKILGREGV